MLTDEARNEYWSQTSSYSDVSVNNWFNNAVCTLSNAGIISGYPDGSFQPNGKITRAEITIRRKSLRRSFGIFIVTEHHVWTFNGKLADALIVRIENFRF